MVLLKVCFLGPFGTIVLLLGEILITLKSSSFEAVAADTLLNSG
jgi:hypothetical protein